MREHVDVDGHDGTTRVRPRERLQAKQQIPYYLGISGTTAGTRHLSLNVIVVPAHSAAEPHTHSDFESAIYVVSGSAVHHWGDRLQFMLEVGPGDFLFIAPGVPHFPENPYDEPVVAVVARNDPDEQEHVIPYERGEG